MALEPISAAYFINPISLRLYVYAFIASSHWFNETNSTAKNTHATIELLDASFSMWPMIVSKERKVGNWFFPELLVIF
jgi:hypothetical protein